MRQQLLPCLLLICTCTPGAEILPVPAPVLDHGNPDRYQFEIDRHSAEYGPFDSRLAEMYQELGLSLQHDGNHNAASKAFIRALQVNRVNHGLYSFQQEGAIRALIDSLSALGNHEQKNVYHQQLTQLNNRLLNSDYSVELAPKLLNSSRWHFDQYHQLRSSLTAPYLRVSIRLSQAARISLADHYHPRHLQLIRPLQHIAESNYYLTRYYMKWTRFFGTDGQSLNTFLQDQSFQQGLQSYQKIIAIHEHNQSPPATLAAAHIALGDYLQLFQQQDASHAAYINAWKTLNKAGDTDNAKRLLGKPVKLPVFEHSTYGTPKAVAQVKVAIDSTGKAHNIEVLKTYPANNQHIADTARQIVRRAIFRNPIINGKISNGSVEFSLPLH